MPKKNKISRKIKKGGHLMLFEHHRNTPYPFGYFQPQAPRLNYVDANGNNFIITLSTHAFKHLDSFSTFFTERVEYAQTTLSAIYRNTLPLDAPNIPNGVPYVDAGNMGPYISFVANRLRDMDLLLDDFVNAQFYAHNQYYIIKNQIRIVYNTQNNGNIPDQKVGANGIGDHLFKLNTISSVDEHGNTPWAHPRGYDADLANGTPTVNEWLYPETLDPYLNRDWIDQMREENAGRNEQQLERNEARRNVYGSPRINKPPRPIYPLTNNKLRDVHEMVSRQAAERAEAAQAAAEAQAAQAAINAPPIHQPLRANAPVWMPGGHLGGMRNNKKTRKSRKSRKSRISKISRKTRRK